MDTQPTQKFFHSVTHNLANLDVCGRVCRMLIVAGQNPPAVTIDFNGGPTLKCTNCGVFTTPVIVSALIDVRKFLHFFGLGVTADGLAKNEKRGTDINITDLGLPLVVREQYLDVLKAEKVSPDFLEHALVVSVGYANQDVAHFTSKAPKTDLGRIALACHSVETAVQVFISSPTGVPVPNSNVRARQHGLIKS